MKTKSFRLEVLVLALLSHKRMSRYTENCSSVCHGLNDRTLNVLFSGVKLCFIVFLKTNTGFRDGGTRIGVPFPSKPYWSPRNQ